MALTFEQRLRRALDLTEGKQSKLAEALDIPQGTISKWLSGRQFPTYAKVLAIEPKLAALEKRLGVNDQSSLSEETAEPSDLAVAHEPNATMGGRVKFPRLRLPVYGQAVAGDDGRFELNGQRIDDVLCPPSLEHVPDAYAVYVHGSSMEPRYYPGETVWVHPKKPVSRGDFVVAQIQNDQPGEPPLGFVKQFVSRNSKELILEQFNPPEGQDRIMRFPADKVITIHKIVLSGQS